MMESIETQIERSSPALIYSESAETKKEKHAKEDRANITISENRLLPGKKDISLRRSPSLLRKRAQLNPIVKLTDPNHPYRIGSFQTVQDKDKDRVSSFTKRVMSAKLLRVKQLQNQLKEAENTINELLDENRVLRTLKKRQDNALKKYEGDQAQLPQLIRSHGEETRVLSIKLKQTKQQQKDLELKLRRRDEDFATLKEQHNHLVRLSQDKHLLSRDKLTKQVEKLQQTVDEQNERIQLLTRRVELEGKNHKHRFASEVAKHKRTQAELTMALETIENLKSLVEAKERYINSCAPKLSRIQTSTTENGEIRFRNVLKPTQFLNKVPGQRLELNTARLENRNLDSDDASQASTNSAYDRSSHQIVESGAEFRKKIASWKLRSRRLPAVSIRDDNAATPAVNTSDDNTQKFESSDSGSATTKRGPSRITSGATTVRNSENGSVEKSVDDTTYAINTPRNFGEEGLLDNPDNLINQPVEESRDEPEISRLEGSLKKPLESKELGSNGLPNEQLISRLNGLPDKIHDSKDGPVLSRLNGSPKKSFVHNRTKPDVDVDEDDDDDDYSKTTSSVSIGRELRRLEEKLLTSDVYSMSVGMKFEDHADRMVRRLTKESASEVVSDDYEDDFDCVPNGVDVGVEAQGDSFEFPDLDLKRLTCKEKDEEVAPVKMTKSNSSFSDLHCDNNSSVRAEVLDESTKTRLLQALKDIDAEDKHVSLAEWKNGEIDCILPSVTPVQALFKPSDDSLLHGITKTNSNT
ncbi:hypothetical protein LSTR_LSTR003114 [Laodelphax striatellus]|uniref:Lebercilin domain-containing protein n=1 Tax=Laodelphax striatellus TaxID=195883 RepID=A0A482WW21_LAOST|nr:hypothetical protein LSTR_LSTR003114 [Laodelphax striatellus]